jgi:hypothetical protein
MSKIDEEDNIYLKELCETVYTPENDQVFKVF